VNVSAKDLGTGKEQQIQITASTNLNKDEVDRMVRDAEAFAAADKAKKEEAEIRNSASSLIYSTEKSLKEIGDKAEESVRGDVETALAELKQVSENGSAPEVKAATEKLEQASYRLAEAIYKSTGASTDGASANGAAAGHEEASANGAGAPDEDVIDAEFKEAK
jgi:molecular chaperone DnaK